MNIIQKLSRKISDHAEYSNPIMKLFGIFGLINYPIFYLYWMYFADTRYDDFLLRIGAIFCCTLLILKEHWNKKFKPFLPIFWYFTVCYCLPFFVTYNFLRNLSSAGFSLNFILALFWLITILDWVSFFIILPLGVSAAYIIYIIQGGIIYGSIVDIMGITINTVFVIITALLFIRKKEVSYRERIHTMKMFAGSIAHELRTPLACINMSARVLDDYADTYSKAYKQGRQAQLDVPEIPERHLKRLPKLPQEIRNFSNNSQIIIDMLLMKLNEGTNDTPFEVCSINGCIEEALDTYPFNEGSSQVHWQKQEDFTFLGHSNFMKHVLYNLLKNALYAIARASKGEIFIVTKQNVMFKNRLVNQLIFKDTGPGIELQHLKHIFDRFYTKSHNGTGIGLAFCQSVIQSFGGDLVCTSIFGKETVFTISLPTQQQNI